MISRLDPHICPLLMWIHRIAISVLYCNKYSDWSFTQNAHPIPVSTFVKSIPPAVCRLLGTVQSTFEHKHSLRHSTRVAIRQLDVNLFINRAVQICWYNIKPTQVPLLLHQSCKYDHQRGELCRWCERLLGVNSLPLAETSDHKGCFVFDDYSICIVFTVEYPFTGDHPFSHWKWHLFPHQHWPQHAHFLLTGLLPELRLVALHCRIQRPW